MGPTRLIIAASLLAIVGGLGLWIVSGNARDDRVILDHSRSKPQGGYYNLAVAEPADLNPYTTVGAVARGAVLRYTHDALMEFDPADGELRPALAERVQSLDGGQRLVFTIRAGVRFADGTKLTMADVLFTHELNAVDDLPLGALGGALDLIDSVRATGPRTLEVKLKTVTFTALTTLATGYTVGKKDFFLREVARLARAEGVAARSPGDAGFGTLLAHVSRPGPGTGPYRLQRFDRGRELLLVQNEHSWRRASRPEDWNLAGFRLLFVQDRAARFAMLRQGRLDLIQDPDAEALAQRYPAIDASNRALTYDHRGIGHFVVIWNHRRPHLADARVRRGLTMLFDQREIVSAVFGGKARRSRSWFRPGSAHDRNASAELPFDPTAARELFDASGHRPMRIELLFAASQTQHRRIVELAQPAFTAARVELQPSPMEWRAMLARLQARAFDGILLHVSLQPLVDPYREFHSSQIDGGRNWMGYADDQVDRILAAARTELDTARRAELFRRFNEIFHRDQPVTLLAHPLSSVLLNRRFRGVEVGPLGLHPEKWWVDKRD